NEMLGREKGTGKYQRYINGVVQATPALDLAVNSNSERGLLSMVFHPDFPTNPSAYVRWTQSASGVDSNAALDVPLLGNRIDRFIWNGSTFTQAENLILIRSLQMDAPQNPAGNHNGGVM